MAAAATTAVTVETPPGLHLVSAFLAMEPPDSLISLARVCGGGSVAESVQRFIWDHCINNTKVDGRASHVKKFLKKLIVEVELNHGRVLDELYEQYAEFMASSTDDNVVEGNARVCKYISFINPDGCFGRPSYPRLTKLVVPLQCSLNMLEGDTGCSIWPSSLFLSEFVLSFPDIFSGKSCFEVGSGVGLVGICLAHVKASEVVLSDGDLSTLANMKLNLELNNLSPKTDMTQRTTVDSELVNCICLPWEYASESDLHDFMPDIILGADVIYDPLCLPHLVRVLTMLLNKGKSYLQTQKEDTRHPLLDGKGAEDKSNGIDQDNILQSHNSDFNTNVNGQLIVACQEKAINCGAPDSRSRESHPVAFIACVIRNIDTFNYFLQLADQTKLTITDITETLRPFDMLPYMRSYDRSSIRLYKIVM